jgi:hypothetical protein
LPVKTVKYQTRLRLNVKAKNSWLFWWLIL